MTATYNQRVELIADSIAFDLGRGTRGCIKQVGTLYHLVEIDGPEVLLMLPDCILKPIHDMEN